MAIFFRVTGKINIDKKQEYLKYQDASVTVEEAILGGERGNRFTWMEEGRIGRWKGRTAEWEVENRKSWSV